MDQLKELTIRTDIDVMQLGSRDLLPRAGRPVSQLSATSTAKYETFETDRPCPLLLSHPQTALCRAFEGNLAPASRFRDQGVTACTSIGTFDNSRFAAIGLELFCVHTNRSGQRAVLRRR